LEHKKCEYIEVSDFGTLQSLFTERFVNGKRCKELLDALGIKYKSNKRKLKEPKKSPALNQ
jgi:hypothetical protein